MAMETDQKEDKVAIYQRRWHYYAYFGGEHHLDVPLEMSEVEVRKLLDEQHYGGNWNQKSLKRGKKYKKR